MTFESRKTLGINVFSVPFPVDASRLRPFGEFDERSPRGLGAVVNVGERLKMIAHNLGDRRSPVGGIAPGPGEEVVVDAKRKIGHAHILCARPPDVNDRRLLLATGSVENSTRFDPKGPCTRSRRPLFGGLKKGKIGVDQNNDRNANWALLVSLESKKDGFCSFFE